MIRTYSSAVIALFLLCDWLLDLSIINKNAQMFVIVISVSFTTIPYQDHYGRMCFYSLLARRSGRVVSHSTAATRQSTDQMSLASGTESLVRDEVMVSCLQVFCMLSTLNRKCVVLCEHGINVCMKDRSRVLLTVWL